MLAYFDLALEKGPAAGTDSSAEVFLRLANEVHPLALGNVKRSISQIRQLAQKMIRLHIEAGEEDHIERVVRGLTPEFYSHSHHDRPGRRRRIDGG